MTEENNRKRNTRDRDLYQKIQEIKGKIKPRQGMLNHHQGITFSGQEKVKGRQKESTKNNYRKDKKMADTSVPMRNNL